MRRRTAAEDRQGRALARARDWTIDSPKRALTVLGVVVVVALVLVYVAAYGVRYYNYQRDLAAYEQKQEQAANPDQQARPGFAVKGPRPEPAPSMSTKGTAPDSGEVAGGEDLLPTGPQDYAAPDDAVGQMARAFTSDWLTAPAVPHEQWVANVARHTSPELVPFLDATPATAVPATTVAAVGVPTEVTPTGGVAVVDLGDDSTMAVTVALTGAGWKVVDYTLVGA